MSFVPGIFAPAALKYPEYGLGMVVAREFRNEPGGPDISENEHRALERRHWGRTTAFTLIAAIAAVGAAIVACLAYIETAKQATDARRQAKAAEDQVEVARDTEWRQLRAYVFLDPGHMVLSPRYLPNEPPSGLYQLKNFGTTPAYGLIISSTTAIVPWPAALYYLSLLEAYIDSIADICGIFWLDETVVIGELRVQYVHGHWSEFTKDARMVRHIERRALKRTKLASDTYWAAFMRARGGAPDETLIGLRQRFYRHKTLHWQMNRLLVAGGELIYRDLMLCNDKFVTLQMRLAPGGYWPTRELPNQDLWSLEKLRDIPGIVSGKRTLDPVLGKVGL
jgi:hypothetical protein